MLVDLTPFDETILGTHTPDPLRFAFPPKKHAHAATHQTPLPLEQGVAAVTQQLLSLPAQSGPRCLYIHVPFCRVRCTYCHFFQHAASRTLIDSYFAALLKELGMKAAMPWTQAQPFEAVYVGGGTPTALSAAQLQQLGQEIRRQFWLTPDCEITLEGRINGFDDNAFEHALDGGFNRFSFGVQSFNTQVRRAAKRLDDGDTVRERIHALSARQEATIVVDLLYGLPYQTAEIFRQDVADYLQTGANGIDLYQLVVAPNTPMLRMVEQGKMPPPATTAEKASLFAQGVSLMDKHDCRRLSVNHWARDQREQSRYNRLAKHGADILPLGCGAGGSIDGVGIMQHRELASYLDAMQTNTMPIARVVDAVEHRRVYDAIKAGLDMGVLHADTLPPWQGMSVFQYLSPLFTVWQQHGLVTLCENKLQLTLAGQFWSVTLAQACIHVLQSL